jgi:hypothetical protein
MTSGRPCEGGIKTAHGVCQLLHGLSLAESGEAVPAPASEMDVVEEQERQAFVGVLSG